MAPIPRFERRKVATPRLRAVLAFGGALGIGVAGHGLANNVAVAPQDRTSDAVQLLPELAGSTTDPAISDSDRQAPSSTNTFRIVLEAPPRDEVEPLLVRSGATSADAQAAAAAMETAFGESYTEGDDLQLVFVMDSAAGQRLQSVAVLGDLGRREVGRAGNGFAAIDANSDAVKRWTLEGGAYWGARRAGLDPASSMALADKVAALASASRIEFVTGERPDRFDGRSRRRLLYVAADMPGGRREFLRDGEHWIAVDSPTQAGGLMRPAPGRITSTFGWRTHPILGFARLHNGIDIAAAWGTPIYAAADGIVSGAGWRGGYGRQVRIAHAGGTTTTYSHLSGMAVSPSARVRRGQLIGHAGASGLATGPHLHFEVLRDGHPVNPLQARLDGIPGTSDDRQMAVRLKIVRAAKTA